MSPVHDPGLLWRSAGSSLWDLRQLWGCRAWHRITCEYAESLATAADEVLRCVRMALSGVARTKGRAGISLIAKMLCGSQAQAVHRLGLDRLSTFGLFAHLRQSEAQDFLRVLLAGKLLEQVGGMSLRPVLRLSSLGKQVMKGEQTLEISLPIGPVLRRKLLATPQPRVRQVERQPARTGASMAERDASSVDAARGLLLDLASPAGRFRASECAAIRQLELDTVEEHLRQAGRRGWPRGPPTAHPPVELSVRSVPQCERRPDRLVGSTETLEKSGVTAFRVHRNY